MNTYQHFLSMAFEPIEVAPHYKDMGCMLNGVKVRRKGLWGALQKNGAHKDTLSHRECMDDLAERMMEPSPILAGLEWVEA